MNDKDEAVKKLYAIFADGCGCECCKIVEKEISKVIKWIDSRHASPAEVEPKEDK